MSEKVEIIHQEIARGRALEAYQTVQSQLFLPRRNQYRQLSTKSGSVTPLWDYTTNLHATNTLTTMPGSPITPDVAEERGEGLRTYGQPHTRRLAYGFHSGPIFPHGLGNGGERFYDDNAWAGLGLVQLHELTGNPRWLRLGEQVLKFVQSGWSDDSSLPHEGGVRWAQGKDHDSRNTVSTAPAAELAVEMYRLTKKEAYLDWAENCYAWVRNTLKRPDELYEDNINRYGAYDRKVWSYNQGTMIGAGVLLHQATTYQHYLDEAEATADSAVRYYGHEKLLDRQLPAFNTIFYRNLLLLGDKIPPEAHTIMAAFCDRQWTQRDEQTGLFRPAGHLNASAGIVEIEALLAGSPARP